MSWGTRANDKDIRIRHDGIIRLGNQVINFQPQWGDFDLVPKEFRVLVRQSGKVCRFDIRTLRRDLKWRMQVRLDYCTPYINL